MTTDRSGTSRPLPVMLSLAGLLIAAAGCDRGAEPIGPSEAASPPRATPSATEATGALALVTNHEDATVSVINVAARSEETTIDVGSGPRGVAMTPDGTLALVANEDDATVSVIDVDERREIDVVDVGDAPDGVAITPDGTLALVANEDDATVSVVDIDARSEETTIDVGSEPRDPAITPDGSLALVTNYGDNTVSVIDVAARSEETTIDVGSTPYRVAISPDGSLALVTNSGATSENVSVVDIDTRSEETTIDVIEVPQGIAITPDGSRALVADFFLWSLHVIDIPARERDDPVPGGIDVGRVPDGVAITPDGSLVLVANSADDAVSVVDMASLTETGTVPVGDDPGDIAIAGPAAISVEVDVKPDSDRNPVNPRGRGLLPVAVLTTDAFDAARIDPTTVTLGDGEDGDTPVAERNHGGLHASLVDVDDDGDADLVLKFEIGELSGNDDLEPETQELRLTGQTKDGTAVEGSDRIEIVKGHSGHGPHGR